VVDFLEAVNADDLW